MSLIRVPGISATARSIDLVYRPSTMTKSPSKTRSSRPSSPTFDERKIAANLGVLGRAVHNNTQRAVDVLHVDSPFMHGPGGGVRCRRPVRSAARHGRAVAPRRTGCPIGGFGRVIRALGRRAGGLGSGYESARAGTAPCTHRGLARARRSACQTRLGPSTTGDQNRRTPYSNDVGARASVVWIRNGQVLLSASICWSRAKFRKESSRTIQRAIRSGLYPDFR